MKRSILLLISFTVISVALTQNPTYRQKLYYSCKVWGFVKYYHSRVSTCHVDWDSVLLHTLPLIKNAVTNNEFNDALDTMLLAAGPMEIATTPSPDTLPPELKRNLNFGWINDPVFRLEVKELLDTIKINYRPRSSCWVNVGGSNGYLGFPFDDPMIDSNTYFNYPYEFTRLLILLKYWNIINYFNPYNYVTDVPWDSTLFKHILAIAEAPDYISFFKTIKKITANLNDAHVELLTLSTEYSFFGDYSPKIILRYAQNNYIVVKSSYDSPLKGDIIVSVDGKTASQWEDSLRPFISAGNLSVFRRYMCQYILSGAGGSQVQITYKDSLGNNQTLSATRDTYKYDTWLYPYYQNDTLENVKWIKWNNNVGYVNMGKLMTSDVGTMYNDLKNTTAIIFDLRNNAINTAADIANLIYPDQTDFIKYLIPDIHFPGTYSLNTINLGYNGNTNSYQGQVIILFNEQTQSSGEYSCMILEAMPGSVKVGSQTAGTDGNVSYFYLSQEMRTGYTSLGVYYPNGDSTERIGIVPDSVVYITPLGIRAGRDEVLEKALQVAGCLVPMLSITPQNQDVTASAGTTSFTITANTNWSAVSDASWCTINYSGSGNGTIIAEYSENTTYQSRIANIQVTVAGLPVQTVMVNQAKSTIGVDEHQENAFQIYPNPTNGKFKIMPAQDEKRMLEISVQDLNGRIILIKQCKGEKVFEIDLSSVSKGIYFIFINIDDNVLVYKLIIN
ncbi:MAG: T9SS C-terminal target domain-containing protein [Bacteroidetes bacterium]|nr:MAG: T9SS C-terminal target domain-containing protein [Bacteroidota bacterium]